MNIADYFADIVMEAPHAFTAGDKTFHLYPLSLGRLMLVERQFKALGINHEGIAKWPIVEVIKVVQNHRGECLLIIYYATAKDKAECFDVALRESIVGELGELLSDEDIATLMVYILTGDKTDKVKAHYGIDKEAEDMGKAIKAKDKGGSLTFGGKTLLGAVIDQACERYGWTMEYAVWGISYSTLMLLLADRVNTIFVSEDERKRIPASVMQRDETVIKASKATMEQIKNIGWK